MHWGLEFGVHDSLIGVENGVTISVENYDPSLGNHRRLGLAK